MRFQKLFATAVVRYSSCGLEWVCFAKAERKGKWKQPKKKKKHHKQGEQQLAWVRCKAATAYKRNTSDLMVHPPTSRSRSLLFLLRIVLPSRFSFFRPFEEIVFSSKQFWESRPDAAEREVFEEHCDKTTVTAPASRCCGETGDDETARWIDAAGAALWKLCWIAFGAAERERREKRTKPVGVGGLVGGVVQNPSVGEKPILTGGAVETETQGRETGTRVSQETRFLLRSSPIE
jgi:hypothetical protein